MVVDQCPCSGTTLARLVRPAVLAVLAGGPQHGYLVRERLAALRMFRQSLPDYTSVYRVLKSMEEESLLTSSWDLSTNGPARRVFALTRAGRTCLRRWRVTLEEYGLAMRDLLAEVRSAVKETTA